jgi:ABC-type transport system involved in multi-copper enzyme maturation permease subunit
MTNLLRAEGLKLRRSKPFWTTCIVAIALSIVTVLALNILSVEFPEELEANMAFTGIGNFYTALGQIQANIIFIAILASRLICDEFSDRTLGLSLFSGFSRSKLLAAKIGMVFVATLILTTFMPLILFVSSTAFHGLGGNIQDLALPMLRDLGLYYLGNLALASLFCLIAYGIRSLGGSIGAGIGIGLVLNFASQIPIQGFQKIYRFVFAQQLMLVGSEKINIPFYLLIMLASLAIFLFATAVIFEKSDLK